MSTITLLDLVAQHRALRAEIVALEERKRALEESIATHCPVRIGDAHLDGHGNTGLVARIGVRVEPFWGGAHGATYSECYVWHFGAHALKKDGKAHPRNAAYLMPMPIPGTEKGVA